MRVVDRVVAALRDTVAAADIIAIVNDPALAAAIGLPHRADTLRDIGALAGVHAALLHARACDRAGVIAVACDMPFVSSDLLREIAARSHDADVVLPESEGRRGVEPLCAFYGVACIDAIEAAAARGDTRMIGFHEDVGTVRVPLAVVRTFGEPAVLFRNLNTPADREAADREAAEREQVHRRAPASEPS
ncbi:hypothetical protein BH23GEM10_BH23GEM10_16560 [soil metagenome]